MHAHAHASASRCNHPFGRHWSESNISSGLRWLCPRQPLMQLAKHRALMPAGVYATRPQWRRTLYTIYIYIYKYCVYIYIYTLYGIYHCYTIPGSVYYIIRMRSSSAARHSLPLLPSRSAPSSDASSLPARQGLTF